MDVSRRKALYLSLGSVALAHGFPIAACSSGTTDSFLNDARVFWASQSGSWRTELHSLICRLALGWPLERSPEEVWRQVVDSSFERFSKRKGGNREWKTKKISTVALLSLRTHFPSLDTKTNRDQVRALLLSRHKDGLETAPSRVLGRTPFERGGGTPNMRLAHAVCGILVAQWLDDKAEEEYAELWLRKYLELRKKSFGSENLSSYQIKYDEFYCLLYQYLPQNHHLRNAVRRILDWQALSYAAHWIDGWVNAANLRDKRSARHVVTPHLWFELASNYRPFIGLRSILFSLHAGSGGYSPRCDIIRSARSAEIVFANERLELDPPKRLGKINPSWTRILYKNRCHSMTTIIQDHSINGKNPLRLENDDTFLHPRLFKIGINNNGQIWDAYATHPATGVRKLRKQKEVWSSHFERRFQLRNVYVAISNLIHGENYLSGPLPYTSADEADATTPGWWLGRWGETLLALWTSGEIDFRRRDIVPGPATEPESGLQRLVESISISAGSGRRCASIWALYHTDQVKDVESLKNLVQQFTAISWLPDRLEIRVQIPVLCPNEERKLKESTIQFSYNSRPSSGDHFSSNSPGIYEFY